jgi:thymidylate synthase (FAD)
MAVMKFEVKMPIFVARQWIRHRTASINEMSARYTEMPDEMFVPEVVALQSTDNKQGRQDRPEHMDLDNSDLVSLVSASNQLSYGYYQSLLNEGVARELARGVLPVNIYTKFIWKMDLHNLMHFLKLRLDPHAQQEIREYSQVIEKMVALKFPMSYEAFVDYQRDAYTCSRMEVEILRHYIKLYEGNMGERLIVEDRPDISARELKEFEEKFFDG